MPARFLGALALLLAGARLALAQPSSAPPAPVDGPTWSSSSPDKMRPQGKPGDALNPAGAWVGPCGLGWQGDAAKAPPPPAGAGSANGGAGAWTGPCGLGWQGHG